MLNDAMFKSVIRSEEARPLVNEFLHYLTSIQMEKLEEATFMGGEIPKNHIEEKGKISDVLIKVENSQIMIVLEMNQYETKEIFEKNTSYAYAINTIQNKKKRKRIQTILINFDAFNPFETKKPVLCFKMRDEDGHVETEQHLSYHLLLENSKENTYNIAKEILEFMDFFKRYESIEKLKAKYEGKEGFKGMVKKVEDLTGNGDFILYYDLEEKHKEDNEGSYELGIERGSKKEKIEIAKKLKELDVPIDKIITSTGLTKKEIEELT